MYNYNNNKKVITKITLGLNRYYRLVDTHTKNICVPGVHCNKKFHQWHQIMLFIFTQL